MTLERFIIICRETPKLKPLWDRMASAAHEVIQDALQRVFKKKITKHAVEHRSVFQEARAVLVAQCTLLGIAPPDLSLANLAALFLRYD